MRSDLPSHKLNHFCNKGPVAPFDQLPTACNNNTAVVASAFSQAMHSH